MIFLQRDSNHVADVLFDGLQARILKDGQVVRDWTVGGVIEDVPQGSGYTLEVQTDAGLVSQDLAIGIIVGAIGQSNMLRWFQDWTTGVETMPNAANTYQLVDGGWGEITGDAGRVFAEKLAEATGAPVGLINGSVGATTLVQRYTGPPGSWEVTYPGSLYANFIDQVNSVGGTAEIIVWIQGESDAARDLNQAEYAAALNDLFARVRDEVGSSVILSANLGATLYGDPNWSAYFTPENAQMLRDAQTTVAAANPDVVTVNTTDLELEDNIHRTINSSTVEAARIVEAYLEHIGSAEHVPVYQGGTDADIFTGDDGDEVFEGGEGADTITAGGGTDIVHGGGGNDLIYGGAGYDFLSGGAGDDEIHGGEEGDRITGDAGNDRLFGDGGIDLIDGGDGDDYIDAGAGNDMIIGGIGNDTLLGGDGNDFIFIGVGQDIADGGSGNDTFAFRQMTTLGYVGLPYDAASVTGGDGYDTIISQSAGAEAVIALSAVSGVEAIIGDATRIISIIATSAANSFDFRNVVLSNIALINMGDGNDQFYGSVAADVVFGGQGDDMLDGHDGDDTLFGEAGNDIIIGGAGMGRFESERCVDRNHVWISPSRSTVN